MGKNGEGQEFLGLGWWERTTGSVPFAVLMAAKQEWNMYQYASSCTFIFMNKMDTTSFRCCKHVLRTSSADPDLVGRLRSWGIGWCPKPEPKDHSPISWESADKPGLCMSLRLRLKNLRRMLGRIRGFLHMSFYNESRDYTMKLFVPENFYVCVCFYN